MERNRGIESVYVCNLLSIAPNVNVDINSDIVTNIKDVKTEFVKEILVQRTTDERFFKEIVTGKLIPVYRKKKIYNDNHSVNKEYISLLIPESPIFIVVNENENHFGFSDDLKPATFNEYFDYLHENQPNGNYEDYLEELNGYFDMANSLYNHAIIKSNGSSKKMVKKHL